VLAGAGGTRKARTHTRSPGFQSPARSGRSTPHTNADTAHDRRVALMNNGVPAGQLVVGYIRADTDAAARPLAEAISAYAQSRHLGSVTRIYRDPTTPRRPTRPGYAACLHACALADVARPVLIVVPTPEHLAPNSTLGAALMGQARNAGAAVVFIDGRSGTTRAATHLGDR
jgi:hypothetical protein